MILKLTLFILFSVAVQAQEQQQFAPLFSPFLPSPELRSSFTILNTHTVSVDAQGNPKILRGMEPRDKIGELYANGITDVLIYKNRNKNAPPGQDVSEIQQRELQTHGVRAEIIPMPWKDLENPREACELTIQALRYMKEVDVSPGRKMFAHCTVGEDRTGMLMGLFRMLKEGWSKEKAFKDEMCQWGYERGNPFKPSTITETNNLNVVCEVRQDLTPLYLRIARDIESKKLTWANVSVYKTERKICQYVKNLSSNVGNFECQISTGEIDPTQQKPVEPEPVCEL